MSSTDYNYDEQGQFFPYFVLIITAVITVPVTYNVLKKGDELESTAPRIKSDFHPHQEDLITSQRNKQKRRERKFKRILFAVAGWLVIAYMLYLIKVTSASVEKIWDPWDILDISHSASDAAIKKQYRKLSITMHPDKRRPDPAKNLTVEAINDYWVEVSKAFKALTDEDVKRNFEMYGNPDGKQGFSVGIALPQFIVGEGNGKYVLFLYGAFLGVLLPYLVGRWWYGTQSLTREGTRVESAGKLFTEYKEDINEGGIIGALSSGVEYQDRLRSKNLDDTTSKVETKIMKDADKQRKAHLSKSDSEKLLGLDDEQRRKALGLLWAYLGRIDLGDAQLDEEKYAVAPVAYALNESFTSMTLAFGNLQPLLASYKVSQSLIQAIPPGQSPLLQLPFFTPAVVEAVTLAAPENSATVQSFMELTDAKRKRLTTGPNLLTAEQYGVSMKVASQIPYARLEKAFFKVTGEKYLTPGCLVQLVVKHRIIPPGTSNIPDVNPKDLLDIDPKEGDLDALHGRNKTDKQIQPPLAHAPYYARDHAPRWRVFLAESRSGKIAVPPFTFTSVEKPIFNEDGTPTFNMQHFKMQFQAPPQANTYHFTMHLICDSYVGMDSRQDVAMVVEDAGKVAEPEEEDEISEPEEDSLAGQMAALKGDAAPKKPKKAVQGAEEDDDFDSDTDDDDDDDDSDSDTDTDTDEE